MKNEFFLNWSGPFTSLQIKEVNHFKENVHSVKNDYGIYQIYGVHPIFGPNSLLYIGRAKEITFGQRFASHDEWMQKESGDCTIYLGRLFSNEENNTPEDKEWSKQIELVERLLINYCSPPYNGSNILSASFEEDVILYNFSKKMVLPFVLSSLWKKYEPGEKINYYTL